MNIEKNLKTSLLTEVYGALLTDKQKEILTSFFDNNMSLGEIADDAGTTKQAVNDLIKRTTTVLENYEQKLQLLDKFNTVKNEINKIISGLDKVVNKQEIKNQLNAIMEIL